MAMRTLSIVTLESRINPGAYTSTFAAGKLTLTGTDDAESIAIRDDGAGVTIIGQGSTTVDGQSSQTFSGPVNSIQIIAKGGDDIVTFDSANAIELSGSLDVNLGSSSVNGNAFALTAAVNISLGSVRLTGDVGLDTAVFGGTSATIAGDFSADFDDGDSSLEMLAGTAVLGSLFVEAGSGSDLLTLDGLTISGSAGVNLNGRGGAAAIVMNNLASSVNGDIKVKSLDDAASISSYAPSSAGGVVSVIGQTASLFSEGPFAARSVYVNGTAGASISISASTPDDAAFSTVTNLSLLAPEGEALLSVYGGAFYVGGQLAVRAANATVGLFSAGDVAIGGDAVTVGDTVAIFQQSSANFTMNGRLSVRSEGFTTLYLDPLVGAFAKDVSVRGAWWATTLNVFGDATFEQNLSVVGRLTDSPDITGGTGSSVAVVESPAGITVNGDFSFTARERNDVVIFSNVQVAGMTCIRAGAGDDVIILDGGTRFEGTTSIETGAGDDLLQFGRTAGLLVDGVTFVGKATIRAGSENDRLEMGRSIEDGGDEHSVAAFNAACSVVDGGAGVNIFNAALGQFTGTPSVINWVSE